MPVKSLAPIFALLLTSCAHAPYQNGVPAAPLANHANPVAESEDARQFYLLRRLPPGATEFPQGRYTAAREHIAAMPRVNISDVPHLAATVTGWTQVGPGNVGGRTRSLAINPQNAAIMYAGAVTGGVWKTINAGQAWTPLFDAISTLNIGAIALDNSNPNTVYAGTGEWYTGFEGDGIYKTTDGGNTWTHLASNVSTNSQFAYVNKIVISPNNSQHVYAATWSGVWASTNGGAAWSQILTTRTAYYGCQDLAIRPDLSADTLLASCSGSTASADYQVLQNTTAPSTAWTQVLTQTHMGRTSLAIAPSQPATIYALAADYDSTSAYYLGLLAVFRSTTGGAAGSWTPQNSNTNPTPPNTLLLNNVRDSTNALCGSGGAVAPAEGQGNYDNLIAVDPTNPNVVWAGGVDLFRSDDGGVTWGIASLWQVAFGAGQFAHADRHVIQFHPNYDGAANQTMYLGNDGGIFRTDNARAAVATGTMAGCINTFLANDAVTWTSLNNSFAATQFYHGFAYPGGMAYMGGSQDNTVARGSDLTSINGWQLFSSGDGTAVGIDPFDANHVLESKERLTLLQATDGGTFINGITGITENPNTFPFVPALAIDPNEGRRAYIGGVVSLWRTVDGANTWTAAAPVEANSSVSAIAINPADSNTVLFGTQMGFIYSNSAALAGTGSAAWASSQPRANAYVSNLTYDPTNPKIVYAVYSSLKSSATDAHVYKSRDGGATWTASDGAGSTALPDTPAFRLLVSPYNPSTLYLGSDLGLFVSTDAGTTWGHDPNQFSAVVVEELAFDQVTNPNWLFAFTYGRAAYRTPLSGSPSPVCSYQVNPTNITADAYGVAIPVQVNAPNGCAWAGLPGTLPTAFQVQSPAQGIGSGTAVVNVEPNTGAARTDTLNIAGTAVMVTQGAAGGFLGQSADSLASATVLGIPGIAVVGTAALSSATTDPVHSCTGSADYKTAWWRVTPASSGTVQILATGRRTDASGNSGVAITAYPASNTGIELGCAVVAQDMSDRIDGAIRFAVTAGTSYLVEVSALGAGTTYNASVTVVATMTSSPDVTLSIAPTTATALPSGNVVPFTAQVANAPNPNVRWSLSPAIGTISPAGIYTPPPSLTGPATVTVTATTFAIPSKQATATITVNPPSGSGPAPAITAVTNAASGAASIAPNAWVAITGTNLAPDTRLWQGSDFVAGQMPFSLDGVTVSINGHKAFVEYISATQVNVLAPLDGTVGPVSVVVSTLNGTSAAFTVTQNGYAPSFFLFAGKYAAATHANGSLLGPTTLYPGLTTPAQRGETIVLYANGFGEVSPGIVPASASQAGVLPTNPTFSIGGLPVAVQFAGVISPGLYQFNVVVPASAPNGDNPLTVTYLGSSGPSGVVITISN